MFLDFVITVETPSPVFNKILEVVFSFAVESQFHFYPALFENSQDIHVTVPRFESV